MRINADTTMSVALKELEHLQAFDQTIMSENLKPDISDR
jgi:hypothetical protein